ncbi:hypothetical protein Mapa_014746 [Marchantia paleacea]|nr:hypothetical protein Mapa_014746 [Marchantia paleacea]
MIQSRYSVHIKPSLGIGPCYVVASGCSTNSCYWIHLIRSEKYFHPNLVQGNFDYLNSQCWQNIRGSKTLRASRYEANECFLNCNLFFFGPQPKNYFIPVANERPLYFVQVFPKNHPMKSITHEEFGFSEGRDA